MKKLTNTTKVLRYVQKNPKLLWLMLCACSPGAGKQFHQWIPHLSTKTTQLKEPAKAKDVGDYYAKIYPKLSPDDNKELTEAFVTEHKKKTYLAKIYPSLKITDIEKYVWVDAAIADIPNQVHIRYFKLDFLAFLYSR